MLSLLENMMTRWIKQYYSCPQGHKTAPCNKETLVSQGITTELTCAPSHTYYLQHAKSYPIWRAKIK